MKRFLALAVVAILLIAAILYDQYRSSTDQVSGFIEADEIRVGSRVGGRVKQVHVEEGQSVRKDQPLVELEPFDLRERLQEAVDRKVAGEVVAAPETAPAPSKVIDIMEALKQSLAREGRAAVPRPSRAAAARRQADTAEPRAARAGGGKKK